MEQELKKMLWLEKYRAEDWKEAGGGRENRGCVRKRNRGWERDMGKAGRGIWERLGEG